MRLYNKGDYYLNGETLYIREKMYDGYWYNTSLLCLSKEVTIRVIK